MWQLELQDFDQYMDPAVSCKSAKNPLDVDVSFLTPFFTFVQTGTPLSSRSDYEASLAQLRLIYVTY